MHANQKKKYYAARTTMLRRVATLRDARFLVLDSKLKHRIELQARRRPIQ